MLAVKRGKRPAGRVRPPAAGLAWPRTYRCCAGVSGLDELGGVLALADLHLARLGPLGDRDGYLEDAVTVAGLDAIGVQGVGQAQAPGDGAHGALADEEPVGALVLLLALRADRQDPAVHGDLDRLGVDAGDVEAEQHVILAPHAVDRHAGPGPRQLPRERVKSCQVHLCLTLQKSSMRVPPGWARPLATGNLQLKLYIPC